MESLLIYILKSAGIISLFYILYILLLKNDTAFTENRKFLLGGILASLIVPAIYFTKKVLVNAPELFYNSSPNSNLVVIPETATQELDWWIIAGTIYLIISGFFLLRFCFRIFQILKMIHFSKIQKDGKFKFIKTEDNSGPFSFFNYIFINAKDIKEDELQLMLTHEKVHARQLHSIDMLFSNLITAVLWFSPISWYYKKSVEQNLEFIADSETAKASRCIQEYQHVLVKVSTNQYQNVLVNHFYQSFIKKRIVMLNKKNTSAKTNWKYQLILPLIAVFMMSFNIKTVTKISYSNSLKGTEALLQNESLSVTINQTTSKESLEKFKSIFQKWDVELNFSNIEYSSNGKIITAIEVSLKNLKTGKTEFLNRSNSNGIMPFEIYVNKNETSGFSDITKEEDAHKTAALQLKEIGKNPLYIINNKEYSSSDLDGKTVRTSSVIEILKPKDARKIYGSKASEGAILVSVGKIIEDFKEELKIIDKENKKEAAYFIEVKKNELPVFISLSNNPSSKSNINMLEDLDNSSINNSNKDDIAKPIGYGVKVQFTQNEIDTISRTSQIMNVRTKNGNQIKWIEKDSLTSKNGFKISDTMNVYRIDNFKDEAVNISSDKNKKVLIVIDGEVKSENYNINEIDPESIKYMNVIKGKNATSKYGSKAKDGVIEISTKFDSEHPPQKDIIAFEGNTKNTEMFVISPSSKDFLVVVDGKIKKSDFDINSINPDEIKGVIVLKDQSAIKKYGKKGEKGVVEITLKEEN